ncbi:zinc finger protein 239-like isoform X1 [Phlebotomus argentipes]|uniref:zinc finger protein 239-like isoform X1 n=1 Tax=Phlebotomus argentipes TaxID=94469 RepID=UPI002892ADA7|nr:zinc finger protein 239-like isoform X1 [Phlebotomus argentipes]
MKKLSSLAKEGRIFLVKMYYYHHMNMEYVKNAYKSSYKGAELPSDDAILETVALFETTGSIHLSQELCEEIPFEAVEVEEKCTPMDVKVEPEDDLSSPGASNCFPEELYTIPETLLKEEDIKEELPKKSTKSRKMRTRARSSRDQLFSCSECNQRFKFKSVLHKHIMRHSERRFSCPKKCGNKFKTTLHANTHAAACIGKVTENFQCQHAGCGKILKTKSGFKRHALVHSERSFICECCGGRFVSKRSLDIHALTHTGEKPFQCDICFKKFTAKATLKTHIRYHTGERPFKCDFCENAFVDRQTMIVHRRQHTGEQPYSCPYDDCTRTFKQKQNLRSHLKHIHNVQPKPNAKRSPKYF